MSSSVVSINASCLKSVTSLYKDAMREAVMCCSEQYGFNGEEALMRLGVDSVTISLKKVEGKKTGAKKAAIMKPSIALPFTTCNPALCNGLKANHGLYTQCQGSPVDGKSFCKGCAKQCEKNDSGKPDNGTIEDRVKNDFKGPKGDAPKHYTAVMKKLKLTTQQVLDEASKFGIEIAEEHFIVPEGKTKRGRPSKKDKSDDESEPKKRGRPKKAIKDVIPEPTEDLFANLVSNVVIEDAGETSSLSGSETSTKPKKSKLTDAEKAAAKEAKDGEKAAAKAAKDAEKLAAKEAKEAEKAAAKAEKEALKKEKDAKKAELEKEKADKKAALEAKKSAPEAKSKKESSKKKATPVAPAVLKVKKFDYKGTKYLKSGNGVVYNMEQDEVGVWNDETKEIEFKEADEEEEEEDYESEDE
jgi:hypothetical protein